MFEEFQNDNLFNSKGFNSQRNDINQSTPATSSSNLNNQIVQVTRNEPINLNSNSNAAKFLVSCVFNDIPKLKKEFGKFELFSNIDALTWFTKVC